MDTHEAVVNPKMGKKPKHLGSGCVMVANQPDLDHLHRLLKSGNSHSRRILMSRLSYGYDHCAWSFIGPFIGAPYAVILLESLIAWGIRKVIFFGWCGAISRDVKIGDVVVPDQSFIDDGTSKNYIAPSCPAAFPSASLQETIKSALIQNQINFHEGPIWATDAIYRETKEKIAYYQKKNALAVEMETAALFSVGRFRHIDVGCILLVSDELSAFKWEPGFNHPVFKERRYQICDIIRNFHSGRSVYP